MINLGKISFMGQKLAQASVLGNANCVEKFYIALLQHRRPSPLQIFTRNG